MSLLYHWKGDNYRRDSAAGLSYSLVQNNVLMSQIAVEDSIWAFTRNSDKVYVLAAEIVVADKETATDEPYGCFVVIGNRNSSTYFDVDEGPDIEPLLRSLPSINPKAKILGSSFQGLSAVRDLSAADADRIRQFAAGLRTIAID